MICRKYIRQEFVQESGTETTVIENFDLFSGYDTRTVTTTPTPGEYDGTTYEVKFGLDDYTAQDPDTYLSYGDGGN